jgi:glutamate-1-semialdehyde aminotransferase
MPNVVGFNQTLPCTEKSEEYYLRALGLIPAATQTLAKGPGQYVLGVAPKYLSHGKGARVWDVDGNEYLDFNMAIGPLSLGYCFPAVDDAIRAQLEEGITFSMMHPLEVEVAEMISAVVPAAERVRFSKTGADVTSAAIRVARAYTGRSTVLCCGYHGWHDWYIGVTDRNRGVPEETKLMTYTFNYNDLPSVLDALDSTVAAVILEPMVVDPPREDFLVRLREACSRNGTVLIFDEMWTGFRLALGGAQEYFGIHADLACFSKAVANGMPLSVLTGRRELMDLLEKEVFFFTTFGGETLSLAAARATIGVMREHHVPDHLAAIGRRLREGFNAIAAELGISYVRCTGMDCRGLVVFEPTAGPPLALKSLVQQELLRRGILWSGFHTVSYSHTEADVEYTLSAYREVLAFLDDAVRRDAVYGELRGATVEPVFRRTGNFHTKPRMAVVP